MFWHQRLAPLAVLLVLAGCSGSSPQATTSLTSVAVTPPAPPPPPMPVTTDPAVSNFFTDSLPTWRSARAAVVANTARAGFAAIGDSTTYGLGGGGDLEQNAAANSWPTRMTALLQAGALPAHAGSFFGDASLNNSLYISDPRVTEVDGGGTFSWHEELSLPTAGGYAFVNNSSTAPLVFTPQDAIDTADVYDVATPGGTPFTADAGDASSRVTITPPATALTTVRRTTVHVAPGNHPITVTPSAPGPALTGVALIGIDTYSSTQRDVAVWNLGFPGSRAVDWAIPGGPQAQLTFVAQLAPALSVIDLGINDMARGTALDAFRTALQAVVTAAQKSGDVILVVPNRIDPAVAPDAVQDSYAQAIRDVATADKLPVYDASIALGSYASAKAAGFMFDQVHPSGAGYAVIANGLSRMLLAN